MIPPADIVRDLIRIVCCAKKIAVAAKARTYSRREAKSFRL